MLISILVGNNLYGSLKRSLRALFRVRILSMGLNCNSTFLAPKIFLVSKKRD